MHFRRLYYKIKHLWSKLTYIHILSLHPDADLLERNVWHKVDFYIKQGDDNRCLVDEIRIQAVVGEAPKLCGVSVSPTDMIVIKDDEKKNKS